MTVLLGRRRQKYGNRNKFGVRIDAVGKAARTRDGILFHSKREADEWVKLRMLEKRGVLTHLRRQVRYPLTVNGVKICDYVADFVWCDDCDYPQTCSGFSTTVADAKGCITKDYALKKALMKAIHNIDIREL